MPATSPRPSISASNSPPGTGTSSTWCGCSCSSASMSGSTARKPWHTARIDLKSLWYKGAAAGPPFLFRNNESPEYAGRDNAHGGAERDARARLQMSALRQGQALRRLPRPAAELRILRARLRLHRCRRWAGDFHHHAGRRDRGRLRADRGSKIPAAVLAARRALAAADSGNHAAAVPFVESAVDRAAIPSQGSSRPADRPRAEMTGQVSRRGGIAGFGVFTLVMVAAFIGLGIWQLQRRVEKHILIVALNERLAAAAQAVPAASQWSSPAPAHGQARRARLDAT